MLEFSLGVELVYKLTRSAKSGSAPRTKASDSMMVIFKSGVTREIMAVDLMASTQVKVAIERKARAVQTTVEMKLLLPSAAGLFEPEEFLARSHFEPSFTSTMSGAGGRGRTASGRGAGAASRTSFLDGKWPCEHTRGY